MKVFVVLIMLAAAAVCFGSAAVLGAVPAAARLNNIGLGFLTVAGAAWVAIPG